MPHSFLFTFFAGIAIAAAGGMLGAFAVMKRMTLAGDVLSHVALPGVGLALVLHFSPTLGAALFLFGAAYAIWVVRTRTKLPEETVIGVFFVAALAGGGLLLAQEPEALETLFGGLEALTPLAALAAIVGALVLVGLMIAGTRRLALSVLSPELAASAKIKTTFAELFFLLAFAAGILLGYRFVGTLLMGALIIVPAAAAKNVSPSLKLFLLFSVMFSILAMSIGLVVGTHFGISPGPPAILVGVALFAVTLFFRKS